MSTEGAQEKAQESVGGNSPVTEGGREKEIRELPLDKLSEEARRQLFEDKQGKLSLHERDVITQTFKKIFRELVETIDLDTLRRLRAAVEREKIIEIPLEILDKLKAHFQPSGLPRDSVELEKEDSGHPGITVSGEPLTDKMAYELAVRDEPKKKGYETKEGSRGRKNRPANLERNRLYRQSLKAAFGQGGFLSWRDRNKFDINRVPPEKRDQAFQKFTQLVAEFQRDIQNLGVEQRPGLEGRYQGSATRWLNTYAPVEMQEDVSRRGVREDSASDAKTEARDRRVERNAKRNAKEVVLRPPEVPEVPDQPKGTRSHIRGISTELPRDVETVGKLLQRASREKEEVSRHWNRSMEVLRELRELTENSEPLEFERQSLQREDIPNMEIAVAANEKKFKKLTALVKKLSHELKRAVEVKQQEIVDERKKPVAGREQPAGDEVAHEEIAKIFEHPEIALDDLDVLIGKYENDQKLNDDERSQALAKLRGLREMVEMYKEGATGDREMGLRMQIRSAVIGFREFRLQLNDAIAARKGVERPDKRGGAPVRQSQRTIVATDMQEITPGSLGELWRDLSAEERRERMRELREVIQKMKDARANLAALENVSWFGRTFRGNGSYADLVQAQDRYEQFRTEYVGEKASRILADKTRIAKERAREYVKSPKIFESIRKGWRKLGDMNLAKVLEKRGKLPKNKFVRFAAKMISVRTAASLSLLGLGGVGAGIGITSLAAQRVIRGAGAAVGSYDLMRMAAEKIRLNYNEENLEDMGMLDLQQVMAKFEATSMYSGEGVVKNPIYYKARALYLKKMKEGLNREGESSAMAMRVHINLLDGALKESQSSVARAEGGAKTAAVGIGLLFGGGGSAVLNRILGGGYGETAKEAAEALGDGEKPELEEVRKAIETRETIDFFADNDIDIVGGSADAGDGTVVEAFTEAQEQALKESATVSAEAVEAANEAGEIITTIKQGGSAWAAMEELIKSGELTKEEAYGAWGNSASTVELPTGQTIHLAEVHLTHAGDQLVYVPETDGIGAHFELRDVIDDDLHVGGADEMRAAYEALDKTPPSWLIDDVEMENAAAALDDFGGITARDSTNIQWESLLDTLRSEGHVIPDHVYGKPEFRGLNMYGAEELREWFPAGQGVAEAVETVVGSEGEMSFMDMANKLRDEVNDSRFDELSQENVEYVEALEETVGVSPEDAGAEYVGEYVDYLIGEQSSEVVENTMSPEEIVEAAAEGSLEESPETISLDGCEAHVVTDSNGRVANIYFIDSSRLAGRGRLLQRAVESVLDPRYSEIITESAISESGRVNTVATAEDVALQLYRLDQVGRSAPANSPLYYGARRQMMRIMIDFRLRNKGLLLGGRFFRQGVFGY